MASKATPSLSTPSESPVFEAKKKVSWEECHDRVCRIHPRKRMASSYTKSGRSSILRQFPKQSLNKSIGLPKLVKEVIQINPC